MWQKKTWSIYLHRTHTEYDSCFFHLWQRKVVPMQELSIAWSVNNLSKNIKCNKICMMCQVCQVFKTWISTVRCSVPCSTPRLLIPFQPNTTYRLQCYIHLAWRFKDLHCNERQCQNWWPIKRYLITFYPRTPFPAPWNIFKNNKYFFILHNQR